MQRIFVRWISKIFSHKDKMQTVVDLLTYPEAFSRFYYMNSRYSIYNVAALFHHLTVKNIPLGPVHTFKQWQSLGNPVARGQQGVYIFAPKDNNRYKKLYVFSISQTVNPITEEIPHPSFDAMELYNYAKNESQSDIVATIVVVTLTGSDLGGYTQQVRDFVMSGALPKDTRVLQEADAIVKRVLKND